MHEWGITKSIIEKVQKAAIDEKLQKVTEIEVRIGKNSGIHQEEFSFCFTTLTKGTIMENAFLKTSITDSKLIEIGSIIGD